MAGGLSAQNKPSSAYEEAIRKVQELLIQAQRSKAEGKVNEAETLIRRALSISEKELGSESHGVAYSLMELAVIYHEKGDRKRAEMLYLRALNTAKKVFDADNTDIAVFLNNLASLYVEMKDYVKAEPLYRQALANVERQLGVEHSSTLQSIIPLASLHIATGDIVQAERLLKRALAISEKNLGSTHPDVADILIELSSLYEYKGDHEQAQIVIKRALLIIDRSLGPDHILNAEAQNILGLVRTSYGSFVEAEALFKNALAIAEKKLGPQDLALKKYLKNLGTIYDLTGNFTQAEAIYKRAIKIFENKLDTENPEYADSLTNLALLYFTNGKYDQAQSLYERALPVLEKSLGPTHRNLATYLDNFAALLIARGETAKAINLLIRSHEIIEQNLSRILTSGSEIQKRLYMRTLSGGTEALISLHLQTAPDNPQAAHLALTTLLQRKGRVLNVVSDQISALRYRNNAEDQALLEKLILKHSQLADLVIKSTEAINDANSQANLLKLEDEITELEGIISTRGSDVGQKSLPVTLKKVQEVIPAGAALVEFTLYRPFNIPALSWNDRRGPPRYAAYVVRHEGEPTFTVLGEAGPIDESILRLRAALRNPKRNDVKRLAQAVDEKVMRPIRRLLGDTRKIFISPDGAFNLIPFGALVDEKNRYLVEDYSFVYLTSGLDLLRSQTKVASRQPPVIVANPQFDRQTSNLSELKQQSSASISSQSPWGKFNLLDGAAEEARELSTVLKSARVLTGADATETALKRLIKPNILHIATHGFFLPNLNQEKKLAPRISSLDAFQSSLTNEPPLLRSGLALAGANKLQGGDGEDGLLTALEVSGLDLWGTKLVVLSACDTGLGDVQNGEGVYGLRRALVLAGAESQVMSLWKVDDQSTRDLMIAFYKRLAQGEDISEALRSVQLEMLKRNEQSHPYFWASFIQSGEWRSLNKDSFK